MTTIQASPESGHFHAVRFYEDAQSLARIVAGFVAEGLIADQPAIVIATPAHFSSIADQLRSMSFDVDTLLKDRRLIALDAQETLNRMMSDGMPHAQLFEDAIVPAFDAAAGTRQDAVVRAYGEMVDVLWKSGLEAAAVRLEMLWNQLAMTRRFSLLCGYSMGSFYKDAGFRDICDQHTHVVSAGGTAAPLGSLS
jgi:DcmR-like sensory protein